ncbi:co-chaperone GroES [Pseudactinotalea sp. HY158]|uniref:GroES family chaperonin n=1 Tax=unclassified Pseudactinotalea TaxID=2649176 RepID=UPI002107FE0A
MADLTSGTLPIMMLHDRVIVRPDADSERRSAGGILIPATAEMASRLVWAEVLGTGPEVRHVTTGDHVLFAPENRHEVEIQGHSYVILREKDLHAVAAERVEVSTGLYL